MGPCPVYEIKITQSEMHIQADENLHIAGPYTAMTNDSLWLSVKEFIEKEALHPNDTLIASKLILDLPTIQINLNDAEVEKKIMIKGKVPPPYTEIIELIEQFIANTDWIKENG